MGFTRYLQQMASIYESASYKANARDYPGVRDQLESFFSRMLLDLTCAFYLNMYIMFNICTNLLLT